MALPIKDLTGLKFGKLTVISFERKTARGNSLWNCRCDCGYPDLIKVQRNHLKSGQTTSCGCARIDHWRKKQELQRCKQNGHAHT